MDVNDMEQQTAEQIALLDEVRAFALAKFAEHSLDGWSIGFDRAVRRFGLTLPHRKLITISKSALFLTTGEKWKNVVLHEIAHALAPLHAGHGPEWYEIAIAIGCDGKRLIDVAVEETEHPTFLGVCPQGHRTAAFRRSKSRCDLCVRRHMPDARFSWTRVSDASALPARPMKQVLGRREPKVYIGRCPSCGCTLTTNHRKSMSCGVCAPGTYDEHFRFAWTELVNTKSNAHLVHDQLESLAASPDGYIEDLASHVLSDDARGEEARSMGAEFNEFVEYVYVGLIGMALHEVGLSRDRVPTAAELEEPRSRERISSATSWVRDNGPRILSEGVQMKAAGYVTLGVR